MSIIDELLLRFSAITLPEMDRVTLLNRVDTKFIFRVGKLPAILKKLPEVYRALEIEGNRQTHYETLYFDTPDYRMYLDHHNKKLNRFKVRSRKYVESNQCFFEVKFKNNRGRTIKKRVNDTTLNDIINDNPGELLSELTPYRPEMLVPSLRVFFSRITLVNKSLTERITLDTGLSFQKGDETASYPGVVIAELKQDRSQRSRFRTALREEHVVQSSMSKYCLGIISLNQHIKKNNFKSKMLNINKLNHDID
ncbi:MAG: polyphosphate polymerase domain-containing protein [Bacteroidales bacterium]|nr:polyphosphate polymerase domain-containing protein [Bacteroidales bacterium]